MYKLILGAFYMVSPFLFLQSMVYYTLIFEISQIEFGLFWNNFVYLYNEIVHFNYFLFTKVTFYDIINKIH